MDTNLAIPAGMDAGAVNMARAIRNRESGTSTDPYLMGDNDTASGRYQWSNGSTSPITKGQIPKNFQDDAKQYGLDPTDFSAKNQDMVAYNRILDLKKKGKNVLQIAALWNSGDENRYDPNYVTPSGLPSQGDGPAGHYDVPAYVKSVNDYYQNLKTKTVGGTTTQDQITPPPDPTQSPDTLANIQQMLDQGKSHDEIQSYIQSVKSGAVTPAPVPENPMDAMTLGSYGAEAGKQFAQGGQKIVDSVTKGADKMAEGAGQMQEGNILNRGEGALKVAQGGAQSFLGTFTGAFQTALAPITPFIEKAVSQIAAKNPGMADTIGNAVAPLGEIASRHPEEASIIGDGINALLAAFGEKISAKPGETPTTVGDLFKRDTYPKMPSFSLGGGMKSDADVLATPQSDVPKLSPREQKFWYSENAKATRETAADLATKSKEAGQKSLQETEQQISDINQKLGETNRNKAIDLKSEFPKMVRNGQDEYLSLTGEADNSPALKNTISSSDLANKIDEKFGEFEPKIAASLKSDLGLSAPTPTPETSVIPGASGKTELPTIQMGEEVAPESKTLTNQQILDNARSMMQDVSKASKTGSRTYSPQELETVKKYAFLMKTIEDNGVDTLKDANNFYRRYAKVRDRAITELKPFDTEATGKMPFTSTLNKSEVVANTATQVASKLDAQNFISELETRMKLPKGSIGSDTRQLMEGLEKAKLSKDTIKQVTDEALAKIKSDSADALKQLGREKFNAETAALKRARTMTAIKWAIGSVLGIGALKGIPLVGPAVKAVTGL
jgi:hypothetical protein